MSYSASHRLREIRIIGGFLDGVAYHFSDKLNCIIGARGTGKTSILEFTRYALNAMPLNPASRRQIETLVESNLDGGRIEVAIETREGLPYIVSRSAGEPPIVLTPDHQATGLNFSPALFRLDVFSQNEIENIAGKAMSQLALLETFNQEALSELNSKIDQTRKTLEANTAAALPLRKRVGELADSISVLPGLTDRLKEFAAVNTEDAAILNKAHEQKSIRDRESHYVEALTGIYSDAAAKVKAIRDVIGQQLLWHRQEGLENGVNFPLLQQMQAELGTCNTALNSSLDGMLNTLRAGYQRHEGIKQELALKHQQADIEFRQLIEKRQEEQTKSAERMKLEKDRNRLLAQQSELAEAKRKQETLQRERLTHLHSLSELLDERFLKRQEIVTRINAALMPNIRVSIQQFGNRETYQGLLADGLKGCQIQHRLVAGKLAELISPAKLSTLIRDGNEKQLIDTSGINQNQAKAVIQALRNEEFLARLEIVDMPDWPMIELSDYGNYKTTETLSTGQKCNTILPILLLDSDRPLLIDQPEDNLDNGFVHKTIVESVLAVKNNRQLVFVTHNPNIPVLGDAERILVLESNGKVGHVRNCGSVDQCKADIVSLLEGGEDAFKKRKERYSY